MQIDDVQSSWEYCLAVGHILPRSKDRLKYHQDSISMHQSQQITQIKKIPRAKKKELYMMKEWMRQGTRPREW